MRYYTADFTYPLKWGICEVDVGGDTMTNGKERFSARYGDAFNELNADVNVLFKNKTRSFQEYYATNLSMLDRVRQSFHNLLVLMTNDVPNGTPKVVSRIKDRSECIRKFELKYRITAEKEHRDTYLIENYITDLVGLRVICLYEDDVDVVHQVILDNFEVVTTTDKTKLLSEEHDKFGYKGLHVNIKLGSKRSGLPEYAGFENFQAEVQIRSIVQDSWSEIDHKLKYKRSIPIELKRRIVRIAALFELADQEFTQIRKSTEVLETLLDTGPELDPGRAIDSFSFLAIMRNQFSYYTFDFERDKYSAQKVDGFVQEISSMDGDLTDKEFKDIIETGLPKFKPFLEWKAAAGYKLNPFTITRHLLYWHNKKIYHDILFEIQRKTLDRWIEETKPERQKKAV